MYPGSKAVVNLGADQDHQTWYLVANLYNNGINPVFRYLEAVHIPGTKPL